MLSYMYFLRVWFVLIVTCLSYYGQLNAQTPCPAKNGIYESYTVAVQEVRNFKFTYSDIADFSKSSWLESAEFYSCNSSTGYLIVNLKSGRSFIHFDVPKETWNAFVASSSFGGFYNRTVKGRYRLLLAP